MDDLALAPLLSDDGTKDDLKTRISENFEGDPDLKQNPRFFGIFNKSRRRDNSPDDPATDEDRLAAQSCDIPPIPSQAPVPAAPIPHYLTPTVRPSTGNPTYYYPLNYLAPFNPSLNGNHPPASHPYAIHTFKLIPSSCLVLIILTRSIT